MHETGGIIGVEALIRWQNPETGLVPPDQFIHVAEDIGLINPIGDWVLREACRQVRAWQDAGLPPLFVAVNVSPIQFRQAGFVDTVARALSGSGLDARYLELELTERTVMNDAEQNLGTLSALSAMGIELRSMNVTPHIAQNTSGRSSTIDGRTTRHGGYAVSQHIRKRIEEAFGWIKTIARQEKSRFRGRDPTPGRSLRRRRGP